MLLIIITGPGGQLRGRIGDEKKKNLTGEQKMKIITNKVAIFL